MERRILLDTSVYGELVGDREVFRKLEEKKKDVEIVFYGCSIIRAELKATPKKIREMDKGLRNYLLFLYDSLVTKENHSLAPNQFVEGLAKLYAVTYKKHGGAVGHKQMKNDLLIIALATIYQMDIVVSNDKRTLLSQAATKAYLDVNKKMGFRDPKYMDYNTFRKKILIGSDI
jgi:predicted nucleic acid-binding protein